VAHSTDFALDGNTIPQTLREIWPEIAAFLLLILCLEWWLFSRGYRHQSSPVMVEKWKSRAKGSGSKPVPGATPTLWNTIQVQFESRYHVGRKRMVKMTKRAKSKLSRRKVKGKSHADI
jgi:hypothetical protein